MSTEDASTTALKQYGRDFHRQSVEQLANILPTDEAEDEREKGWHDILKIVLETRLRDSFRSGVFNNRRLVYAPIDEIESILDCGYGTGVWAEDLAEDLYELYEDQSDSSGSGGSEEGAAEQKLKPEDVKLKWKICGIDIARDTSTSKRPSSSGSIPRSESSSEGDPVFATKVHWDLNQSLTSNVHLFTQSSNMTKWAKEPFDLVNIRCLTEGIKYDRWGWLLRELWTLLRPRGCIQMVELAFGNIQSDSGRLNDATGLQEWTSCYRQGLRLLGRTEPHLGKVLGERLQWAGFEDISSQCIQLDLGNWRHKGEHAGNLKM
ncbi:hypothetical protein ANO11243_063240 [Dothideomycetidae sp. 11243]|nr:hypothetical protein ANO11243_063240 [fungal sp. No.11243]